MSELEQQHKAQFLELMRAGESVAEACRRLGIARSTFAGYRKRDPEFRSAIEQAVVDTAAIRRERHVAIGRSHKRSTLIPREPGQTKKIAKYIEPFLYELARGKSPTKAAEAVGVAWGTVYRWKADDPEFAQRWAEAMQQANDRLEDEALRRAVEGYNPRPVFDREGNKVCEIRDYSDTLLMQRLRGRMPEVYNRPDLSVSTKVEVRLTREQARERLQQFGLPVPQLTTEFEDDTDRASDDGPDRKQ